MLHTTLIVIMYCFSLISKTLELTTSYQFLFRYDVQSKILFGFSISRPNIKLVSFSSVTKYSLIVLRNNLSGYKNFLVYFLTRLCNFSTTSMQHLTIISTTTNFEQYYSELRGAFFFLIFWLLVLTIEGKREQIIKFLIQYFCMKIIFLQE